MTESYPSGQYPAYQPVPDEPFYRPVPSYPDAASAWPYAAPSGYVGSPVPLQPPPPPDPMPAPGTEYVQFFRTGRNRWWKGVVAIVLLAVGFLGVSLALGLAAISLDLATGRIEEESLMQGSLIITPALLLAINLSAAMLIPLSMLLQWWLYGQPVRWLHSIRGHLRWDLLRRLAVIIVPVWLVYVGLSIFVFPQPPSGTFTAESAALLAVVLLTTPLQSAGEEYGARGLIARAAGSWLADARIALVISAVVSATIFTVAHGTLSPWLIAYYFVFGVAMSVVVWRTGGLEVAVLIHTINNLLLFVFAIASGQDLAASLERDADVGGPVMLIPLVVLALTVATVWWWTERKRVARGYEDPPRPPEVTDRPNPPAIAPREASTAG